MPNVSRLTVTWTGFQGAPGYSKFSFIPLADDTARNAAGAALRTFFVAVAPYIPNGVTWAFSPVVDDLDILSGELVSSATMTTVPTNLTSSTTAAPYPGGSGCAITWLAPGVFHGRRKKGRTFLVPTAGNTYDPDGTLSATLISTITTAGNALIATAGADLAVWNRAYAADHVTPIEGALTSATSCTIKDMASQLRSRRL